MMNPNRQKRYLKALKLPIWRLKAKASETQAVLRCRISNHTGQECAWLVADAELQQEGLVALLTKIAQALDPKAQTPEQTTLAKLEATNAPDLVIALGSVSANAFSARPAEQLIVGDSLVFLAENPSSKALLWEKLKPWREQWRA